MSGRWAARQTPSQLPARRPADAAAALHEAYALLREIARRPQPPHEPSSPDPSTEDATAAGEEAA